jgi:hypothetical protein
LRGEELKFFYSYPFEKIWQVLETWQVLGNIVFPSKFAAEYFVFYNILLQNGSFGPRFCSLSQQVVHITQSVLQLPGSFWVLCGWYDVGAHLTTNQNPPFLLAITTQKHKIITHLTTTQNPPLCRVVHLHNSFRFNASLSLSLSLGLSNIERLFQVEQASLSLSYSLSLSLSLSPPFLLSHTCFITKSTPTQNPSFLIEP